MLYLPLWLGSWAEENLIVRRWGSNGWLAASGEGDEVSSTTSIEG